MNSSHAITTCEMLARGISHEYRSSKDKLARIAIERERRIEYLKTVTLVNAIIGVGNVIAAAVSGSPGNQLGGDKITKSLELLKELLIPEESEKTEKQALEAREKLSKEVAKGPLKVRAVGTGKAKKKRGQRKKP